jgi:hypothetical protein
MHACFELAVQQQLFWGTAVLQSIFAPLKVMTALALFENGSLQKGDCR